MQFITKSAFPKFLWMLNNGKVLHMCALRLIQNVQSEAYRYLD